jgi:quercetin dioxygenase-like cupin family protein
MRCVVCLLLSVMAMPLLAQKTPPSELLDAATLHATGDALLAQARTAKDGMGWKVLLTRPDGNEQMVVRVKSGQGEWHRNDADVLIGLEGEAQVITGGSLMHGVPFMPGEMSGDRVAGGTVQSFRAGDVLRIEPRVPHQFLMQPGMTMRYLLIKIRTAK